MIVLLSYDNWSQPQMICKKGLEMLLKSWKMKAVSQSKPTPLFRVSIFLLWTGSGSSSSTPNLSTTNSSRRASSHNQSSDEPCSSRSLGQCGIRRTVGTNFWSPASILGKRQPSPHNSKKKGKNKSPSWTHTFVCLASVNQDTIPDQDERACLQIADGEKKVQLTLDSNATDIYDEILEIYPKLRNCGGW